VTCFFGLNSRCSSVMKFNKQGVASGWLIYFVGHLHSSSARQTDEIMIFGHDYEDSCRGIKFLLYIPFVRTNKYVNSANSQCLEVSQQNLLPDQTPHPVLLSDPQTALFGEDEERILIR